MSARSNVNVVDALAYVTKVRQEYSGQPSIYEAFLSILKDFKANAIDARETERRVAALFQNRPHLIHGFQAFLPH